MVFIPNHQSTYAVIMAGGGGTRLKVLEAWGAGLPVVATATAVEGLGAVDGQSYLEARGAAAFVDAEIPYELYALKDTRSGQVIGCIRVTKAQDIATIAQSREEYHLDKFPPAILARTQVFTRLVILKDYRKSSW